MLLFLTVPVLAATGPTVTGETEFVKKGGYVEYSVSISDNPGISAFLIYIDCDQSVFSLDYDETDQSYKVTCGEDFRSGTMKCNVNDNKGYQISWYHSTGSVQADGNLFTLRFKASTDVQPGTYPITLRYSEKNTLDANMERLPLTCVSGTITVASDTAKLAVESTEAAAGEQFTLRVRIDENPGIAAYAVYLLLDTSVFSAIPTESGEGFTVTSGTELARENILCNTYSSKGYKIQWWNSTENIRAGTLFELPLIVSDSADAGEYSVEIKVSAADTTDEKGVPLTTELTDGTITVRTENWKNVTAEEDSAQNTVTVTGTPCVSGPSGNVNLIAASYTESGQMLSCRVIRTEKTALNEPKIFTLACPERANTTVKLFILDVESGVPLCETYTVDLDP